MDENILKEFNRLDDCYGLMLVEVAKLREIERAYAIGKGLDDKDKYENPFRVAYDKERVLIDECNKDVLRSIRQALNSRYPNVPTNEETFKGCIARDKLEQNVLNFDNVAKKILELEENSYDLAVKNITAGALRLMPYRGYDESKIPFKLEDIQQGNKLVLHSGWSYNSPRTDHEGDMTVFCYYVLFHGKDLAGITRQQAQQITGVTFKYYKNGRCDAIFDNEEQAIAVGQQLIHLHNKQVSK